MAKDKIRKHIYGDTIQIKQKKEECMNERDIENRNYIPYHPKLE
jgi:hypothetical protein